MKTNYIKHFFAFQLLFVSIFLNAQSPLDLTKFTKLSYHYSRTENFEKIYSMNNPTSFLSLLEQKEENTKGSNFKHDGIGLSEIVFLNYNGINLNEYPNVSYHIFKNSIPLANYYGEDSILINEEGNYELVFKSDDTIFYMHKGNVNLVLNKIWSETQNAFVPESIEFYHYFAEANLTVRTDRISWESLIRDYNFTLEELAVLTNTKGELIFSQPKIFDFLENDIPFLSHFSTEINIQFTFLDSVEMNLLFKTEDKESLSDFLSENAYLGKLKLYSYKRNYDSEDIKAKFKSYQIDSFLVNSVFTYRNYDPIMHPIKSKLGGDSIYQSPDGSYNIVYPRIENTAFHGIELITILLIEKQVFDAKTKKMISKINKIAPIYFNSKSGYFSKVMWFDWDEIQQFIALSKSNKPLWFTNFSSPKRKGIVYQQWGSIH